MTVKEELAGRTGNCSFCRHPVTVPPTSTSTAPVPAVGATATADAPGMAGVPGMVMTASPVEDEVVTAEVALEEPPDSDDDEGIDLGTYVMPSSTTKPSVAAVSPAPIAQVESTGELPLLLSLAAFAFAGCAGLTAMYGWSVAAHSAVGYAWLGLMAGVAAFVVARRRAHRSGLVLAALAVSAVAFLGIAVAAFASKNGGVPGK